VRVSGKARKKTSRWASRIKTSPERATDAPSGNQEGGIVPLLWLLVILLVIFAIFGGVAINSFLWLVLIVALIVAILAMM
jgi:Flp pilus assembly protein TadB